MRTGNLFLQTATDHDMAASSVNFLKGFIQASDPADATSAMDCLTNLTQYMDYLRSDVGRLRRQIEDETPDRDAMTAALAPFVDFAVVSRDRMPGYLVAIKADPDTGGYLAIHIDDVRNLLRAAGLFTDEMQAPTPPSPGPDLKPEGASPPAEGEIG